MNKPKKSLLYGVHCALNFGRIVPFLISLSRSQNSCHPSGIWPERIQLRPDPFSFDLNMSTYRGLILTVLLLAIRLLTTPLL